MATKEDLKQLIDQRDDNAIQTGNIEEKINQIWQDAQAKAKEQAVS